MIAFACGALLPGLPTAGAQEVVVVAPGATVAIDRDRVARDLDGAERSKSTGVHRFSKSAIAPMQRVPVPVFLPAESLDDYQDTETKSAVAVERSVKGAKAVGEPGSLFVATPDGYTVSRTFDRFDFVVRGTNRVFGTDADSTAKAAATPAADYVNAYSETEDGGVITFGYAGAHYTASFECRAGSFNCVTSTDAQQIVDDMLLCGFDDRCVQRGTEHIKRQ